MSFEINWPIVIVRILDGLLYGTGFVVAVAFWVSFIKWLTK